MKKLSLTPILLLIIFAALAQAPQGISHQAVIRDASNQLVTKSPIGIQVSIIQGTPEGTIVYSETHTPNSNANGLISFVIGQGTVVSGVFAEINWASGPYFIKTEADPAGGTNYTITGTSEIFSVPYAFYSENGIRSMTLEERNALLSPHIGMLIYNLTNHCINYFNGTNWMDICSENITPGQSCAGIPSVTDVDGNVYNTVKIGNQCWLKEDLKTTKYRDGSSIEYPGSDDEAWQNNTSGAYAWYDNDIGWKDSYGALYNWHAVNNSKGLCPAGWHVASYTEWWQLRLFAGERSAQRLKSCRTINSHLGDSCNTTEHPRWESPGYSSIFYIGFDDLGLSLLPGGYRSEWGFGSLGSGAFWWTKTEFSPTEAYYLWTGADRDDLEAEYTEGPKSRGYSIRCIKSAD